jgi:hypothetical protein
LGVITKNMNKQTNKLLKESENLLKIGNELLDYGCTNVSRTSIEMITKLSFWTIKSGELLNTLYPKDNHYHQSLNSFRKNFTITNLHSGTAHYLSEVMGVLEAVKYDLENGLLDNIQSLLQADIFANFLEMGEYLLKEGYKDAAAVIIGSVLEDTLRKMSITNGLPTTNDKGKLLTIEPLNVELAKKEVYNQLIKKQITSWADLRNNAAHGHFNEYDAKQVQTMLEFVESFTTDSLR